MHEIDALAQNVNHTSLNAQLIITCNGPKIRMCANSENQAIKLDMKEEQQSLHCLNHTRGGLQPLRGIVYSTTNNLIQEKHGKTLDGRKNNFSTLLVDILPGLTLLSSK